MNTAELYDQFIVSRQRARLSPDTIAWYGYTLRPLVARMPGLATTAEIEAWLDTAPSNASARSWLRAARAMFNWQTRRFGIPSPTSTIVPARPSRTLPRVFTIGELRLILSAAARDARDAAAIAVLIDTGIRIGELHSIRAERIEYDDQQGTAAVTVHGKTGSRRVPLTTQARAALMRIAPPTGPVWTCQPGPTVRHMRNAKPMAKTTLELRIRAVIQRAGVTGPKTGPHTFRHTFATMYLRQGGDIYRLQRLLGHASIKQTTVYLHLADPEAFEEHSRLSPLTQLRTNQPRMAI